MQIFKQKTTFDFVGKRNYAAIISGLMVLASIALFIFKGPNWGIDFTGGTEIQLKFHEPVDISEMRAALTRLNLSNDAVQQINGEDSGEYVIRIQDPTFGTKGVQEDVQARFAKAFGADWIQESKFDAQIGARMIVRYGGPPKPLREIEQAIHGMEGASVTEATDDNTIYVQLPGLSSKIEEAIRGTLQGKDFEVQKVDSVGPKVGGELRRQGMISIFATLGLILAYVGFRFELAFAPGAVLALFHDVTVVVGIFVLLGVEFNLPIIGALLTIIGYSLNDTIVIYDRIRENMNRYRRRDLDQLINDSVNETLTRTLATSFTTFVAMIAFLVLGGPVIETFALAILLGVIFGTYSTVYVASPMIIVMQSAKPKLEKLFAPLASAAASVAPKEPRAGGSAAAQRRKDRQAHRKQD